MSSLPQGILRVLAWFDSASDELKAVINDDGEMPVNVKNFPTTLDIHHHSYDSSDWVKNPIVWGYTDRWVEQTYLANAATGVNTLVAITVPAGYVYRLDGISSQNVNNICNHWHDVIMSAITCRLAIYNGVAAGVVAPTFPIGVILKEGDYARAVFTSVTAADDLYVRFWGVKMKVDM